jgi:hypothetical protein
LPWRSSNGQHHNVASRKWLNQFSWVAASHYLRSGLWRRLCGPDLSSP